MTKPNTPERRAEIRSDMIQDMAERLYVALVRWDAGIDLAALARASFKAARAFADEAERQAKVEESLS